MVLGPPPPATYLEHELGTTPLQTVILQSFLLLVDWFGVICPFFAEKISIQYYIVRNDRKSEENLWGRR